MINKVKTVYHVTLAEAKQQCNIDPDETRDDALLNRLIKAATQITENEIQKDIAKTTNVLTRIDFSGDTIRVNEGNLISITTIETAESETPLSNFNTYIYRDSFRVELDNYVDTDLLTVTFETGFAVDKCPEALRQAILVKVADLFDYDRASSTLLSVKNTGLFETLCAPYKSSHVKYEEEA